ncbi:MULTISPECIES: hypothetical protein [unclassified Paenibacillus]|uniref:hypothetical protein n=1 Tax=unclassified Paenibacillus TaxID=185978 RepID=UPI001FD5FF88|nr:hypothetical protein [Paenibacillus sp. CFBP 13594]
MKNQRNYGTREWLNTEMSFFTEERLLMSDQALDTYLHQLTALQETKDSERMMKAVEEAVVRFK